MITIARNALILALLVVGASVALGHGQAGVTFTDTNPLTARK